MSVVLFIVGARPFLPPPVAPWRWFGFGFGLGFGLGLALLFFIAVIVVVGVVGCLVVVGGVVVVVVVVVVRATHCVRCRRVAAGSCLASGVSPGRLGSWGGWVLRCRLVKSLHHCTGCV